VRSDMATIIEDALRTRYPGSVARAPIGITGAP
jgi:hypothetical protein